MPFQMIYIHMALVRRGHDDYDKELENIKQYPTNNVILKICKGQIKTDCR